MKILISIMALLASGPALAQKQGPAEPPPEKINQVMVYGNQPCPKAVGEEIVVCMRSPDEPYRVPRALRNDTPSPDNLGRADRIKAIEYVGRSGIQSCTPVGAGGFTGCMKQIVNQAYAERAGADTTWTQLVAAERAKRLGNIDAESAAIEARAKQDEAAAKPAPANAPPPKP